jgi:hypothetical protein
LTIPQDNLENSEQDEESQTDRRKIVKGGKVFSYGVHMFQIRCLIFTSLVDLDLIYCRKNRVNHLKCNPITITYYRTKMNVCQERLTKTTKILRIDGLRANSENVVYIKYVVPQTMNSVRHNLSTVAKRDLFKSVSQTPVQGS